MRPTDQSDPDPKFGTILLHVWPKMLMLTLAHLTLLIALAGLFGPLIFPALPIFFWSTYSAIKVFYRKEKVAAKVKDPEDVDIEEDDEHRAQQVYFAKQAALCSTWLPSIVGTSQKTFLVSALVSLTAKVALLVLALALASCGLQNHINKKPFLLFCATEDSPLLNETGIIPCKFSEGNCLPNPNFEAKLVDALTVLKDAALEYERIVNAAAQYQKHIRSETDNFLQNESNTTSTFLIKINQSKAILDEKLILADIEKGKSKIRVCEENENLFRLTILIGLLVVTVAGVFSTFKLHWMADYQVNTIKYHVFEGRVSILIYFILLTLNN